jgi:hypothetical protein
MNFLKKIFSKKAEPESEDDDWIVNQELQAAARVMDADPSPENFSEVIRAIIEGGPLVFAIENETETGATLSGIRNEDGSTQFPVYTDIGAMQRFESSEKSLLLMPQKVFEAAMDGGFTSVIINIRGPVTVLIPFTFFPALVKGKVPDIKLIASAFESNMPHRPRPKTSEAGDAIAQNQALFNTAYDMMSDPTPDAFAKVLQAFLDGNPYFIGISTDENGRENVSAVPYNGHYDLLVFTDEVANSDAPAEVSMRQFSPTEVIGFAKKMSIPAIRVDIPETEGLRIPGSFFAALEKGEIPELDVIIQSMKVG